MRVRPPSFAPADARFGPSLRTAALATVVAFTLASAAWAAPDSPTDAYTDPVARLLAERGLIPAAGSPAVEIPAPAPASPTSAIVQQVRDGASDMVVAAMNFLGVPYRRGGNNAETGFDCSGFTRYVFQMSLGLVLPRRADEQASAPGLFSIAKADLKPGDLVFFNTLRRTFSHVGIYIGDGKFIHSPRAGHSVRVEDMRIAYWQQRFTGARRVDAAALPGGGHDTGGTTTAKSAPAPGSAQAMPVALQAGFPSVFQPAYNSGLRPGETAAP